MLSDCRVCGASLGETPGQVALRHRAFVKTAHAHYAVSQKKMMNVHRELQNRVLDTGPRSGALYFATEAVLPM